MPTPKLALAVHLAAILDDDIAAGGPTVLAGDGDAGLADIRHDRDGRRSLPRRRWW